MLYIFDESGIQSSGKVLMLFAIDTECKWGWYKLMITSIPLKLGNLFMAN